MLGRQLHLGEGGVALRDVYHLVQVGRARTEHSLGQGMQLDPLFHAPLEGGDRLVLGRHVPGQG